MDHPVHNPSVPYTGFINGGFGPGRTVRIQGRIHPSANHFTVNLQSGSSSHDDINLHFNVRLNENAVVRNSRTYSSWGAEERHGSFPFVRGQHFEIMIMSEASRYMIAVNGQHFTEFNHRGPSDRVNHVHVDGDVSVALIQFEGTGAPAGHHQHIGASAPPMAASAPYPATNAPYPPMGLVAPSGGAPPYPPTGGPGYPPAGGPGYPPSGGAGYPPAPGYPQSGPPPPAYGGGSYPHSPGHSPGYAPPPGAYPAQPGYASPPGHYPPGGGYPQQQGGGYPQQQGGYPQQQGGGYPPPHGYPDQHKKGGGLLDNAGKLLGAGLAGVGLASVANKVGIGGHGGHGHGHGGGMGMMGGHGMGGHGMGHGGGHGGHSGGGIMGGALGSAAALGVGGLVAQKALKGKKGKNKLLKYGLPLAGVGVGGYALSKGVKGLKHGHKGFGHHGSSSSSSSSSSEEE